MCTVMGSADLAALRIVRELLFMEKRLLAGTEHEFCSALNALQNPIGIFHNRTPSRKKAASLSR